MAKHALLSASGAHRWLECTPSALLELQFPQSTSEYAEEGTAAHELCELTARYFLGEVSGSVLGGVVNALAKRDVPALFGEVEKLIPRRQGRAHVVVGQHSHPPNLAAVGG